MNLREKLLAAARELQICRDTVDITTAEYEARTPGGYYRWQKALGRRQRAATTWNKVATPENIRKVLGDDVDELGGDFE